MLCSNYHTHTTYCDGVSTPIEMADEAIRLGLSELGFSSHSPLLGEDWCLSPDRTHEYFDEISMLKEKYREQLKIFVGIEQDYMSDKINLPFDYIIGSVHSVETAAGERFVDISSGEVAQIVYEYFAGDVYTLCEAYYDRVGDIVARTGCDIIGHFDLVTKFTECGVPIDELHPRYIAAQDKALDKLLSTNAVFEVNTGAMARGYRKDFYPSVRVLERIRKSGKSVVLNSDCHSKDQIVAGMDYARTMFGKFFVSTFDTLEQILAVSRK